MFLVSRKLKQVCLRIPVLIFAQNINDYIRLSNKCDICQITITSQKTIL